MQPVAHFWQVFETEVLPLPQEVHCFAPDEEIEPTGQDWAFVVPPVQYLPAGQIVQFEPFL